MVFQDEIWSALGPIGVASLTMCGLLLLFRSSLMLWLVKVVPPGYYMVLTDTLSGKYVVYEPGMHFSLRNAFLTGQQNPWDGKLLWPMTGRCLQYDPDQVHVMCKLNEGNGSASGTCDIKMVLKVADRVTASNVQAFMANQIQGCNASSVVNDLANEYVRSVCHKLDYGDCSVLVVAEGLMRHKEAIDLRIQPCFLQVESFVVESIAFALDAGKQSQDTKEYGLMRKRKLQEMEHALNLKEAERKSEESRLRNRRRQEEAEMDNRIKIEAADAASTIELQRAQTRAEAETVVLQKQKKVEQEHAERMVAIVGVDVFARLLGSQALASALGNNTHLISPSAIGLDKLSAAALFESNPAASPSSSSLSAPPADAAWQTVA